MLPVDEPPAAPAPTSEAPAPESPTPGEAPALAPPSQAPPGYAPPVYGGPHGGFPPVYGPAYPPRTHPIYVPRRAAPQRRVTRGNHLHDGFYLRMGLGVANHRSQIEGRMRGTSGYLLSDADATLRGAGAAIDLAIGGTPAPGLVVGVELGGHSVVRPTLSGADAKKLDQLTYSRFAAMLDWYPNPQRGLHVQGSLGFATTSYSLRDSVIDQDDRTLTGWAWSLGIGYEAWVGAQWSLGGVLRLDGASLRGDVDRFSDGQRQTMLSPALLVVMTYH